MIRVPELLVWLPGLSTVITFVVAIAQLKVVVPVRVVPSVTVMVTLNGLPVWVVGVPVISPVEESIERPPGTLPTGLSIDSSTGLITGTPTTHTGSPFSVTITVTDTTGGFGSTTFTWTINNVFTVTNPGSQVNKTGTAISTLHITATDSGGATLHYSASGLPPGTLAIGDTSGDITGTPSSAVNSPYSVTITVTDGTGASSSVTFLWTIRNVITITDPHTQSDASGAPITALPIVATDSQTSPAVTLTYSAVGLPSGLSIDPSTGVISGAPDTAGTYIVTVTVTDNTLAERSISFQWTIT